MAQRYAALLPGLESLRAGGVPVPAYSQVVAFDGGTLAVQERLPGRSADNPPPKVVASLV